MPVNDFRNLFERIVLTQGAISARKEMGTWLKDKQQATENAAKEGEPDRRMAIAPAPDPDRGDTREAIVDNLVQSFTRYHASIFKYASRYNKRREWAEERDAIERVFQVEQLQPADLANLRQIFTEFVEQCYDEHGRRNADIDDVPKAAKAMQKLYEDLKTANHPGARHFVPLRYLRFPASLIITELGSSEKWKDINHGQGINFNRGRKLQPGDKLDERFLQAFSGRLDEENEREFVRQHNPSTYIPHNESYVEIEGYRFPCLKFPDPEIERRTHLVTDNGYTVNLTNELRDHLIDQLRTGVRADKLKIPFTVPVETALPQETPSGEKKPDPATLHLSGLIQKFTPQHGTDKQRKWAESANGALQQLQQRLEGMKGPHAVIDGQPVQDGQATLLCMDVDLLTGLSMKEVRRNDGTVEKSEVARLGAFIRRHAAEIRPKAPADLAAMSDFLPLLPKPKDAGDYLRHIDATLRELTAIAKRENNRDIEELITAAAPHIKAIAPRVMEAVDGHFKGITPADKLYEQAEEGYAKAHAKCEEAKEGYQKAQKKYKAADKGSKDREHYDEQRRRYDKEYRKYSPDENAYEAQMRQHKKPRFFMTIGGAAAGKSNAEKIANEECGKGNYVIAGLDHVRGMFDRQALNIATDNHNFDYKNIEQAGKLVRAAVLERARKQGYHVLLDGSGIPYENRYGPIVAAFKGTEKSKYQYRTSVIGFDRTLYVNNPELRKKLDQDTTGPRKAIQDAFLQQGIRKGNQLRAMPVQMIASNYAQVPEALLQASQDPNVDRFWLIDNNPKKSAERLDGEGELKPYVLSFTADVTAAEVAKLDKLQGEELKKAILKFPDKSGDGKNKKIARVMTHPKYSPADMPGEKWNFKVINKIDDNHYRIEVITDAERYLGTLEKGLFNIQANGPEELFKLTKAMSFDVEGLFQNEQRTLRMQPEAHIAVDEWPQIPHATGYSLAALDEPCWRITADSPAMRPVRADRKVAV